jgi:hypothetical protein
VVDDPSQADFILAHGTEALAKPDGSSKDMSLNEMQVLLQQCAKQQGRQLPMVVANPDLVRRADAPDAETGSCMLCWGYTRSTLLQLRLQSVLG